jgi:hypothetical protein
MSVRLDLRTDTTGRLTVTLDGKPRLVELQGRCLRVCADIRGPGGRQRDGLL